CLAKGYLHNAALTAERFLPDPFFEGEKMYRTGDLVKWRPDGNLEFLGRCDDQVKIRGFRIELGEITQQLASHPSLHEVSVVTREIQDELQLVAYYLSDEQQDENNLKEYLKSRLPDYMVPVAYVHLAEMPLTASGKLNRKALPAPDLTLTSSYTPAGNELEEQLVHIWSEVLKLDREQISVTQSFFELGGHSLRATAMVNKVSRQLNFDVPLATIFQYPTIHGFSQQLSKFEKYRDDFDEFTILLKRAKSMKNLFIIHDGSGELYGYRELTSLIDDINIWGLKYPAANKLAPESPGLSEMASTYIARMKKVQPNGPYTLLGWSLGGVLGIEIVKQLELDGDKVDVLIAIDSYLPADEENMHFSIASEKSLLQNHLSLAMDDKEYKNMEELWKQAMAELYENHVTTEELRKRLPDEVLVMLPETEYEDLTGFVKQVNVIRSLGSVKRPSPSFKLDAQLVYLGVDGSNDEVDSLNQFFTKKVLHETLDGDHFSIMKLPHVLQVVNKLLLFLSPDASENQMEPTLPSL
ncbi:AMP-binding protein, partial [Fulvivirga sp. M361]|uniref:thioesterase domain-containing protein n=1 Tax=Fulvivirga sp. M361 TaxID=2594266 RepID=UPI00117AFBAB